VLAFPASSSLVSMGSGASTNTRSRRSNYWCHSCQTGLDRLVDGGLCPICRGGFVEETTSLAVLTQATRWLAGGAGTVNSTEARIARLLDDLHAHLEMVEGLHESMRRAMNAEADRPHLDPASDEVLNAIQRIQLDAAMLKSMRQTAQCVVCCADFEVGETLSQLPGCGHLFHDTCVRQWLERAANCPICRCNLMETVASGTAAADDSEDANQLSAATGAHALTLSRAQSSLSSPDSTAEFAAYTQRLHSWGSASGDPSMGTSQLLSYPVTPSQDISSAVNERCSPTLQAGSSTPTSLLSMSGSMDACTSPLSHFAGATTCRPITPGLSRAAAMSAGEASDGHTRRRPNTTGMLEAGMRRPASSVLVGAGSTISISPVSASSHPQPSVSQNCSPSSSSSGLRRIPAVSSPASSAMERQTLSPWGRTSHRC